MKIYQLKGFWHLILILLLVPVPVPGQDILYKKDSTILNVSIKEFDGRTIKFTNPEDPAGKTCYLSKSVLDSLTFGGKTVNFPDNSPGTKLRTIKRNYLHSDMVNTMSGMINLDYERISGSGQTGFVAGILVNVNKVNSDPFQDHIYYHDVYNSGLQSFSYAPHVLSFRVGINFYPFNHSLTGTSSFRPSTGFSLLAGAYRKVDYNSYNSDQLLTRTEAGATLVWNIKERVFLGDHVQIDGGLELSLMPFFVYFCPQLGVAIGF